MDETDLLNASANFSRKFEHVTDNNFSPLGAIISEALEKLGGVDGEVFGIEDIEERLRLIQDKLDDDYLDIKEVLDICIIIPKMEKVNVGANSAVKDLNVAVLLTHFDLIGTVFYYRGIALMGANRIKQAIEDFTLAIKYRGKSAIHLYQMYHKMGQCFIKLKEYKQGVIQLKLAFHHLKSANLEDKAKQNFQKAILESVKKFSKKLDMPDPPLVKTYEVKSPHPNDGRLSDSVEILETIGMGRNAYASRDIGVGNLLAVDTGITTNLNPDNKENTIRFCLHCLKNVEQVPYPCSKCARVIFCGPICQQLAEGSYHKYQCQLGIHNLRQKDTKESFSMFNSFNTICSHPLQFWMDNQATFLLPDSGGDWPSLVDTDVKKYQLLFQMVTHQDLEDKDTRARNSIIISFLLRCLRKTTYYQDGGVVIDNDGGLTKEEIVIGKIMYRLKLINAMNAHPIWGVERSIRDRREVGIENIGGGIFTAIASYFNSDCNPNTMRVNVGSTMLLIACRDINKGDEISDNYCIHFSEMDSKNRLGWIEENYKFKCQCRACEEEWPTFDQLPGEFPTGEAYTQMMFLEKVNSQALVDGKLEMAIEGHKKEMSLIQENVTEPHQLLATMRNSFQYCWWRYIAANMSITK